MIQGLVQLFIFQALGELVSKFALPFIPGPVLGLVLLLAATLWPAHALLGLTLFALLSGMAFTGLKMAALFGALLKRKEPPAPIIARLPIVSVMVALYREANIAPRLVKRLGKLDYPQELLDVLLVVEADDHLTRAALDRADLPGWMRIVVVPDGTVKTKPRALNFALDHCRGSIVGVYDAEDAPEPDQIRKVVDRFHARGPDLACLQGRLDFYNPRVNWFSRCFTIEYAAWFRLLLPGIERLGLAVPLGGTTLFFRNYYIGLPDELIKAAQLDGAGFDVDGLAGQAKGPGGGRLEECVVRLFALECGLVHGPHCYFLAVTFTGENVTICGAPRGFIRRWLRALALARAWSGRWSRCCFSRGLFRRLAQ